MEWRFIPSILDVSAGQWNALCPGTYPFVRYEFLAALEQSGCTSLARGWQPHHLIVMQGGELVAALPAYIKHHSYGEYVFDWSWADAWRRHGQNYYPKLVTAIPFTPCFGERLLVREDVELSFTQVLAWLDTEVERLQLSGWHCLFPDEQASCAWQAAGAAQRLGCQFHWFNRGYQQFDDFLAAMNSRKRKNIMKERRELQQQGIVFEWREGVDISPADWADFYQLYRNTYLKRSGNAGYLTEAFFQQLGAAMPDNLLLIHASNRQSQRLASALFLRDDNTLYGRYWGCFEEHAFLHFETCYYQGIEYAIAKRLQRFDGGAQGEHKIQRGFEPVLTYSNHRVRDPDFHRAITLALAEEAEHIKAYQREARSLLPFK